MKIVIKKKVETESNTTTVQTEKNEQIQQTTEYKLIKVGTYKADKTYKIEPPCRTVIGLSYHIFSELSKEFSPNQKTVVRKFYLEAMNGKYKGVITQYEGNRTMENDEKPYKYKFYVKNNGVAKLN